MSILYLLGIRIFQILITIASLFNLKAKLWVNGRRKVFQNLKIVIKPNEDIAWFHCASLGEFEQGRPVIKAFKEKYPSYKILLTFYSPSGYEIRKNYERADYVFYMPLDTPSNAKQFMSIVNPKVIFFVKYEFWYFFLKEIRNTNTPLYLISGIFREDQRFFKSKGVFSKKMLSCFKHFFVQNNESKILLNSVNINNVTITGDTRFDRVYSIAKQSKKLPVIEQFTKNDLVLIAGSTWKPDEELLIKYFNESNHNFKMIIAPHEIHKENITRIVKSFTENTNVAKYSDVNENKNSTSEILIIDNIGLLSSLYKYGNLAYIGGGFGKGLHNILEAATFGLPVIFGPNHKKFQEAIELKNLNSAFLISNYTDLKECLDNFFENLDQIKLCGKISAEFVENKRGATESILKIVEKDLLKS